jgi:PleD family two-component response regulator
MLLNQAVAPDVILLKLGAKDVDAFKVLEKLRQHPRLGKVAVVMMADAPSREDIAKSILVGASGWMIKPYTEQVINAAIQGVLTFPPVA